MMAINKMSFVAAGLLLLLILNNIKAFEIDDTLKMFGQSKPVECVDTNSPTDSWITLAWITLMVGVVFNALLVILSGALSTPKYSEFIKGGIWGLVETAAILSIFSLAFIGLKEWGDGNLDNARAYSAIVRNTVIFQFTLEIVGSTVLGFISRQQPPIKMHGAKALGITYQIAPMLRPLFDGIGLMVQLLAASLAEWIGHEFFLCFIKTNMLGLLLPIGIFLRALGIRGGGNALIGMAIALYFVYPYLMVQVGEMLSKYFVESNKAMEGKEPLHIVNACNQDKPICCIGGDPLPASMNEPFLKNGRGWETNINDRLSRDEILHGEMVLSVGQGIVKIPAVSGNGKMCMYNIASGRAFGGFMEVLDTLGFWTLPAGAAGIAGLNYLSKNFNLSWLFIWLLVPLVMFVMYTLHDMLFFLFVVSLIMPIMMIFITITLAKEIAKVLGTEIDLSSLEKLI